MRSLSCSLTAITLPVFSLYTGHQDITNVLVANLDNKITKQAFLYDLLINESETLDDEADDDT